MGDERRYDEHEVGLILKRVAELHERDAPARDARSMTREEIEDVVGDLGISKALVVQAAAELSVGDHRNRPNWWLGGHTDLMFEEVIEGSVDDLTYTRMLEVLRRCFGDPGEVKMEGGARIWSTSQNTGRKISFSVVDDEGTTTLRLEERMQQDAQTIVGLVTGTGWFMGIMSIVTLKAFIAKAVLLLMVAPSMGMGALAGWLGGRAVWKSMSARRATMLKDAFRDVVEIGRRSAKSLPPG